jgi:23S rRNA (cytidine1920-2'-O)/16S rRNA (cytidine1409-2'-O)-methyltransferase
MHIWGQALYAPDRKKGPGPFYSRQVGNGADGSSAERTNVAALDRSLVPDRIGIVTVDLSYLSIAALAPQLRPLRFAPDADLVALVKPMYELGLATPPHDPALRREAVARAGRALAATGWRVAGSIESPVRGARGAVEHLLHARRTGG